MKGEISATFDFDLEPDSLKCIFVDMDGIPVPFFINEYRPKGAETWLLTIDGVDSAEKAAEFVNKPFSALATEVREAAEFDPDADGFYASDLIGFGVEDSALGHLGRIADINDSTENVLFVVEREDGSELLIPVADEFIDEIDADNLLIHTTIPPEIAELNL
ncbi:MAG: 16S rRNA processing protein RimM [Muribaculaceae bacterium]|nr:16S rRNA processing protein RimM [Muribaculaceae bacterium]